MKIPTDLEILEIIYANYIREFCNFDNDNKTRDSKIYVPIDIQLIASKLNVDNDIVFGRLYYHLEPKYSYQRSNNAWVNLFVLKVGKDTNAINFPLLTSIVSGLKEEQSRNRRSLVISVIAITISFLTLGVNSISKLEFIYKSNEKIESKQLVETKNEVQEKDSTAVSDKSPNKGN